LSARRRRGASISGPRRGIRPCVPFSPARAGDAPWFACDVTDRSALEETVTAAVSALGGLDVVVANAGIAAQLPLVGGDPYVWDRTLAVNLSGVFHCCKAAQKYMTAQRSGKIVSLSSRSALGNRGQANYAAAKAGIQAFTATLAIELGPFNVNVNCVAPGFIETAMTRQTAERMGVPFDQFAQAASEQTPLRRVGQPEDVAGTIAFLCSEDAGYVSGQVIYVAGGPRN